MADLNNDICANLIEEELSAVLQPSSLFTRKPISWTKIPYPMTDNHKQQCKYGLKITGEIFHPSLPDSCRSCLTQFEWNTGTSNGYFLIFL